MRQAPKTRSPRSFLFLVCVSSSQRRPPSDPRRSQDSSNCKTASMGLMASVGTKLVSSRSFAASTPAREHGEVDGGLNPADAARRGGIGTFALSSSSDSRNSCTRNGGRANEIPHAGNWTARAWRERVSRVGGDGQRSERLHPEVPRPVPPTWHSARGNVPVWTSVKPRKVSSRGEGTV